MCNCRAATISPKSDATKSDLMTNNHGYYCKALLITWFFIYQVRSTTGIHYYTVIAIHINLIVAILTGYLVAGSAASYNN